MNLSQTVHAYLANVYKDRLQKMYIDLKFKHGKKLDNLEKHKPTDIVIKEKQKMATKQLLLQRRIKDNEAVDGELYSINFQECLDMNLLGPAKVFCDRLTMYFHPDIKKMDEEKAVCAILCAFFNSKQDYPSIWNLNESRQQITAYQSALAMYHIGVITEKLWYCNQRHKMALRMEKDYSFIFDKYQIHKPSQIQSDYIILKAIDTKNPIYGNVYDAYTTMDAIEARVQLTSWSIKETGIYSSLISPKELTTSYFVINPDSTKTRVQWNKKELKQHKDITELAKEMVKAAAN